MKDYAKEMRTLAKLIGLCSLFLLGLAETSVSAAMIQYQTSRIGSNGSGQAQYCYTYTLNGLQLSANQEIDIRFDPALYDSLSNGKTNSGLSLQLFQPNSPPMATGDYSDFALVDNPPLTGIFSVDFVFKGQGTPGSQPFFINQYSATDGRFLGVITSGATVPFSGTTVPEPKTLALFCLALLPNVLFGRLFRRFSSVR